MLITDWLSRLSRGLKTRSTRRRPKRKPRQFQSTSEALEERVMLTAPTAIDDAYTTPQDSWLYQTDPGVLGNDTDPESDPLTAVVDSLPANGTLYDQSYSLLTVGSSFSGGFTYMPNTGYSGLDSFTYHANDGVNDSNTATVTIDVQASGGGGGGNAAPTAFDDEYLVPYDSTLSISDSGVLNNDTDPEFDPLTGVIDSLPANGTLTDAYGGALSVGSTFYGGFQYTPNTSYLGLDSFTYHVDDGQNTSNTATVEIDVYDVLAFDDEYDVLPGPDGNLIVDPNGVLGNDWSADGDPLTVTLNSGPGNGTLTFNSDGSFEYIPTEGFFGVDTFGYTATDGSDSDSAVVSIYVNTPPSAVPDDFYIAQGGTLSAGVLGNDYDPEGDSLKVTQWGWPNNGTLLELYENGSFVYEANPGFTGIEEFYYEVADDRLTSSTWGRIRIFVGTASNPFGGQTNDPDLHATVDSFYRDGYVGHTEVISGGLHAPTVALGYNSGTALPSPIIALEAPFVVGSTIPTQVIAHLNIYDDNDVPLFLGPPVPFDPIGFSAGEEFRIALQATVDELPTGRYRYEIDLVATYSTGPAQQLYGGELSVLNVNGRTITQLDGRTEWKSYSAYGPGWSLAGVPRVYENEGLIQGVNLTWGDSSEPIWFAGSGFGGYPRPAGVFYDLEKTGGGWELEDEFGSLYLFNSDGILTDITDRNGNFTLFDWIDANGDGKAEEIYQITETTYGRQVTFAYAFGYLDSITDQAGRVYDVVAGPGGLSSVTTPDPDGAGSQSAQTTSFGYSGDLLSTVSTQELRNDEYLYGNHNRIGTHNWRDGLLWTINGTETFEPAILTGFGAGGYPGGPGTPLARPSDYGAKRVDHDGIDHFYETDHPLGLITEYINPLGRVDRYTYDGNGLLVLEEINYGGSEVLTTAFGYDGNGNLTSVTWPDGSTRSWAYDSQFSQLLSETDEEGHTWSWTIDAYGNVTSQTDALGRVTTWTYNSEGLLTSITEPDPDDAGPLPAPVTSFVYDGVGRLVTQTNPDGTTETLAWDATDFLTSTTDTLGRVTSYLADNLGRRISATNPAGTVTDFHHDDANRVTGATIGPYSLYSNGYDARGRMTIQDVPGGYTSYDHNNFFQVTQVLDEAGGYTYPEYDIAGRLIKLTRPDPDGPGPLTAAVYDYAYDIFDRRISETDPDGNITLYDYDQRGRLIEVIDSLSGITSFEYDLDGSLVAEIDPLNRRVDYSYDAVHNLTSVVGPDGGVTAYAYDNLDRLISITDPNGNVTAYTYDSMGRLLTTTDATGGTETNSYDNAGRLTSITNALGQITDLAYDAVDNLVSITKPDPAIPGPLIPFAFFTHDVIGNVLTETDALGNVTTYAHDGDFRVTDITNALGQITSLQYAPFSQVAEINDNGGFISTAAHDTLGRTTSATNSNGGVTAYAHDKLDRVTTVTDANGNVTTNAYDALSRLISVTDALGGVTSFLYDAASQLISTTDPLGRTTSYAYDNAGRTTSVTDPLGNVTSYAYDNNGNLLSETDPLGRITSHTYDTLNRRTTTTDPLGGVTSYAWDAASNLLTLTDAAGNVTSWVYDQLNRRTSETNALGHTRSWGYDLLGNATTYTDARGNVTTNSYDALSRLISSTDPLGGVTTRSYTAQSQIGSITDPLGRTMAYSYDGYGNTLSVTDYHGNTTSNTFDPNGNLLTSTDSLGNVTTNAYDALNRLTSSTDPLSGVTGFTYDAVGNRLSLTDPVGNVTNWSYDALDRATTETNALGHSRNWTYDAVSNVTQYTDRIGRIKQYTYDAGDRRTQEQWIATDGTTVVNTIDVTYNPISHVTAISDDVSAYAFTRDALGQVLQIDNFGTVGVPNVTLDSTFDPNGNRTQLTADIISVSVDFQNDYTYDALNRVTQITQLDGDGGGPNGVSNKRIDLAYNAGGQYTSISRYEDLLGNLLVATSTYGYDTVGRLNSLDHDKGATSLASYSWTFDGASRVTNFTSVDGSTDYTYDNTNQLTAATHSFQTNESYTYDANGNRTLTGYSTGTNNQLLSDGVHNFEYDQEGNRTKKTTIATGDYEEYEWDHRNRLTAVTFRTSTGVKTKRVDYTYDALDNLIRRRIDDNGDGSIDRGEAFVYDMLSGGSESTEANVVLVFDDTGSFTNRYLHGNDVDQVFADESIGEVLWGLADNQGTVRDIANYDPTGDTAWVDNHRQFDAFGNITSETNASVEFRYAYTGRYFDEDTGLQNNRARWYDPVVGRWISEDPIGFEAGDANISRYVGNNSINAVDPDGLEERPAGTRQTTRHRGRVVLNHDGSVKEYSPNTDRQFLDRLGRGNTSFRPIESTMHYPRIPTFGRQSLAPNSAWEIASADTSGVDWQSLIEKQMKRMPENSLLSSGSRAFITASFRDVYIEADKAIGRTAKYMLAKDVPVEQVAEWRTQMTNKLKLSVRAKGSGFDTVFAKLRAWLTRFPDLPKVSDLVRKYMQRGMSYDKALRRVAHYESSVKPGQTKARNTRTNAAVNKFAIGMKWVGGAMIVLDVGIGASRVASQSTWDARIRVFATESARITGGLGGAVAGGHIGFHVGSKFGNPYTALGGSMIGGLGGAMAGSTLAELAMAELMWEVFPPSDVQLVIPSEVDIANASAKSRTFQGTKTTTSILGADYTSGKFTHQQAPLKQSWNGVVDQKALELLGKAMRKQPLPPARTHGRHGRPIPDF